MATASLPEKVLLIEEGFRQRRIPHAFGGAIALAYYATPRGTQDVDINLFVPASDLDRVLLVIAPLGVELGSEGVHRLAERDEQVRVYWDGTPLDLFFSYDALHDACFERRRRVAFPGEKISILSAEDLAIFKVLFAREKDWRDLQEMLFAQGEDFDAGYAVEWLESILANDDDRLTRFTSMLASETQT